MIKKNEPRTAAKRKKRTGVMSVPDEYQAPICLRSTVNKMKMILEEYDLEIVFLLVGILVFHSLKYGILGIHVFDYPIAYLYAFGSFLLYFSLFAYVLK